MRLPLLTLVTFIAASAASVPALAAERNFPVTDFTEISLAGSPDVKVTTGGKPSVVAVGSEADLDRLDIRVQGNRLVIGTKPGLGRWSSREGVTVRVSVPAVSAASISGSGDMSIDQVRGAFTGRISGSGGMQLPSVDSPTLSLSISGSGDMKVAGRCGTGTLSIAGSGDIQANGLTCQKLTASTTGSGDIAARATETADLRLTGSGDITIAGGARCTSRATGSGSTRCG